jgi:hypothetical protein
MLQQKHQPVTQNKDHFFRHRTYVPISPLTKTKTTPYTPGNPSGNSNFSPENKVKFPNRIVNFSRKIAQNRAKLIKKTPLLSKINHVFAQNTSQSLNADPHLVSIKYFIGSAFCYSSAACRKIGNPGNDSFA